MSMTTPGLGTSPVAAALQVYREEPCARTFHEDLWLHLCYGYVLSTPTTFVMCRPVCSSAPLDQVVDPRRVFEAPDCWHIYLLAGDFDEALTHLPYELKYVSWERDNKLRRYPLQKLVRLRDEKFRMFTIRGAEARVQGRRGQDAKTDSTTAAPGDDHCRGECRASRARRFAVAATKILHERPGGSAV